MAPDVVSPAVRMEAGARGGHKRGKKNPFYEMEVLVGIVRLPLVGVGTVITVAAFFGRANLTQGGLLMEGSRDNELGWRKRDFWEFERGSWKSKKSGATLRAAPGCPGKGNDSLVWPDPPGPQRHLGPPADLNNSILGSCRAELNTVNIVFSGTSGRAVR